MQLQKVAGRTDGARNALLHLIVIRDSSEDSDVVLRNLEVTRC